MAPCFQRINEVCCSQRGNRYTHSLTHSQNDYRNPRTCVPRVKYFYLDTCIHLSVRHSLQLVNHMFSSHGFYKHLHVLNNIYIYTCTRMKPHFKGKTTNTKPMYLESSHTLYRVYDNTPQLQRKSILLVVGKTLPSVWFVALQYKSAVLQLPRTHAQG